jgi:hypothetical protein
VKNRQALFLNFDIQAQPDMVTCGPTCLHALYEYYNDKISLKQVIGEVKSLKGGGTLDVMLANHALKRGYKATIFTYNWTVFDPSWSKLSSRRMIEMLRHQMRFKPHKRKLQVASRAYIRFLEAGGKVCFDELGPGLIKKYLHMQIPILAGLSATHLYLTPREMDNNKYHSTKGEPVGHFVIVNGYDDRAKCAYIADPMNPNPLKSQYYSVNFDRLIHSIMLGIVTYDSNLLVIEPR